MHPQSQNHLLLQLEQERASLLQTQTHLRSHSVSLSVLLRQNQNHHRLGPVQQLGGCRMDLGWEHQTLPRTEPACPRTGC